MKLKPYTEYKESGVPWLGQVPRHWEVRKTKYLFNERIQKGFPNEPLLAATQTKGVVPKTHYETRTVTAQKDFHLLKLVKKGDFVISLRSFQGGIEFAYYQGIISPAYTVMVPWSTIDASYFRHLAKSKPFIGLLTTCVTGIREGQNVDYVILKRNRLPVPTLNEQTQIARFLDYKSTKISHFIRSKKRMIELLKEQKQAIINDAVTGKIDVRTGKPYPKYKESGVEWLRKVPEGWDVRKVKHIAKMKSGESITSMSIEEQGEYPVYGGNGLRGYHSEFTHEGEYLLIGRQGALCGNVHFVVGKFWASEHAVVTTVITDCSKKWFYYLLTVMNLNQYSESAAQPGISVEKIQNLRTAYPSIKDQEGIVGYIENHTVNIDLAISRTEREISLIQEYRARLIADVVTGKIDVCGIEVPAIPIQDEISLAESDSEEVKSEDEPTDSVPAEVE